MIRVGSIPTYLTKCAILEMYRLVENATHIKILALQNAHVINGGYRPHSSGLINVDDLEYDRCVVFEGDVSYKKNEAKLRSAICSLIPCTKTKWSNKERIR